MRRLIALLALLVTASPHAAAFECALHSAVPPRAAEAPRPDAHRHAHLDVAAEHASGPVALNDGSSPVGGPQCSMVMACGHTVARAGALTPGVRAPIRLSAGPVAAITVPQPTVLVADPPPPRRNA